MEPRTKEGRTRVISPAARNCPSCPRLYQLIETIRTLSHEFVDVVDELEAEDDVVAHHEVDPHAVDRAFFDLEGAHLLGVVVLELQLNVAVRPALAHQLNAQDLHLCRLVFLEVFLIDVAEQRLLVGLQRLVILVLSEQGSTR